MPSPQQSDDGATKHRHSGDLRLVSEPGVRTVDADAFAEVWVSELDTPALIQAALVTDEPLEVWLSERLDAEAATIMSLPPPPPSAPALIVATGVRVPNARPARHWMAPVATFAFGVVAVSAMLGVAAMLGPVTLPPQPELFGA